MMFGCRPEPPHQNGQDHNGVIPQCTKQASSLGRWLVYHRYWQVPSQRIPENHKACSAANRQAVLRLRMTLILLAVQSKMRLQVRSRLSLVWLDELAYRFGLFVQPWGSNHRGGRLLKGQRIASHNVLQQAGTWSTLEDSGFFQSRRPSHVSLESRSVSS